MTRHFFRRASWVYLGLGLFFWSFSCRVQSAWRPSEVLGVPGVAFSLTPNHGTAVVYFANRSFAEVAYIQGSPEYRAFMNRAQWPRAEMGWCTALPEWLWPITIGHCAKHPDIAAARGLLRALSQSVASYLGTTFCFADIVLPDPDIQTYQRKTLEQAIQSLALRQPHQTLNAARLAVFANKLGEPSDPKFAHQVVLGIDYSSYGLNAVLMCYDGHEINILRQRFRPSLGADEDWDPNHWRDLKSAIEEVAKPPFADPVHGRSLPKKIQSLVLYGDKASDADLNVVLKSILGVTVVAGASIFDPLFSSAVGMAETTFDSMNLADFEGQPSFWCPWKSKLYHANPHIDL